jgi:hypothetical protein
VNFNFRIKQILSKWPILLLLLMMPVLVLAQQDDKDKDKKKNPPPPPKKSDKSEPPKQTPPPGRMPPPKDNPRNDNPPKDNPKQNPPTNQNPPPNNAPKQGTVPPTGNPPNGGQPNNGQPNRGGPPNNGQPNRGNPPNNGQPNRGGQQNGGQPNQPVQPHNGVPPNAGGQQNGGQPPRGNPPNGGQPFAGQPGQGGNRNREPNHAPVPPPQQVRIHNGNATVIRAGGNTHVTTIRTTNFTINRTDYGRRVVSVRPGGVTVVSIGNNRGFVQRPAARVGFVQRTYVVRGRPYVRVYRSYNYRGIAYVRYVPAYYYSPRFYIWAYNPWVRPVYFGWGWGRRAPWFYGGYFAPAPYYVSASLWLTDYIIAENLRASYEAELDAQGQQYAPPPPDNSAADPNDYNNAEVSPALRQAIADEVQRQLNAEKNASGNPQAGGDNSAAGNSSGDQAPPALAADQRVFVVSAPLQVYDGDQPCSLTAGDVISRVQDSPGDDGAVGVSVLSSKNADCRPGAQPRIQVTDLQDMSNDLRAQTDEGLKKLSEDQGKNGLPPAPDVTTTPNPNGQGTPDPDAVNQLKQQQQDADQTEKEVGNGQGGPGGSGGTDGSQVKLLPDSIYPTTLPFGHRDAFLTLTPAIDSRPDLFLAGLQLTPDSTASSPDIATRFFRPGGRIYFDRTF